MSLLRNQPVNPLNKPAVAEQAPPVQELDQVTMATLPAETAEHIAHQVIPATNPLPVQASQGHFNDGFDDLDEELGFGSFSRIKLDSGIFWLDDQKFGTSFNCNIFQVRKVYIHRSKEQGDDAQAVWCYEDFDQNPNAMTTNGEPVASVLSRWRAEGHDPVKRITYEAAATIVGGEHDGQIATLSIPQASTKKFAGYSKVMTMTKGLRVPQVITKVSVGDPIKSGTRSFQPWVFEYAGVYQAAQAA